jgi:DNA-binding NtrC family response regulator
VESYILIVDDEENIREICRTTMKIKGYNSKVAKNGQEGLELALKHKPALVITDLMMPIKNGLDMITDLVHHYPDIKIVAMSGSGTGVGSNMSEAIRRGATGTLEKPFGPMGLINIVESCLKSPSNTPIVDGIGPQIRA